MFGNSPLSSNSISSIVIGSANTASSNTIAPYQPSNYNVYDRAGYGVPLTNDQLDMDWINLNNALLEDANTNINILPSLNLDFANSKRLDPRITFTRASGATYYDGSLPVLAEQNLFVYSNSFYGYGPNLAVNGTFNNNEISGWTTVGTGSIYANNNVLYIYNDTILGGFMGCYQVVPTTIGRTYRITGQGGFGNNGKAGYYVGPSAYNDGTYYLLSWNNAPTNPTFVATSTTTYLSLINAAGTAGLYGNGSNVSIREVIDGSYSYWTLSNSRSTLVNIPLPFTTGVTAKVDSAGNIVASKFVGDNTTSSHSLTYTISNSGVYTVSIYVKAVEHSYFGIGDSGGTYVYYDLINGTYSSLGSGWSSASITPVGNGWYRCTATATNRSITSVSFYVLSNFISSGATSPTSTVIDGYGVYIYGAQFEQRSTATNYNETSGTILTNYMSVLKTAANNVPRFDFNPTTGESLGLLIEQSSTNLLTYSQDFSNSTWNKYNSTITTGANIAPDGTQTFSKLTESTATSQHNLGSSILAVTANSTYNVSAFVKYAGVQYVMIGLDGGVYSSVTFDIVNGIFLRTTSVGANQYITGSAVIQNVGNGCFRISASFNAYQTNQNISIKLNRTNFNGQDPFYTGDGYSGVYIWGAQLEALAFATSYIPTTSVQVIRTSDNASMTGTNFSSWYNASEGTIYSDFVVIKTNSPIYTMSTGVVTNGFYCYSSDTSNYVFYAFLNTVQIVQMNAGTSLTAKNAFSVKTNNYIGSVNGNTPTTVTTGTIPVPNQLNIGFSPANNSYLNGRIKKLAYYPQALTSAQLQSLTGRL